MKARALVSISILASLASTAQAATRTIQFTGIAGTQPTHDNTLNSASVSDCRIVISNTGSQAEDIQSVLISVYSPTTGTTQNPMPAAMDSLKVDDTTNTTAATCTGKLDPGGFCIFRTVIQNVAYDGYWAVCSGQIQVQDDQASQPGSVTAAGAILTLQEAQVMGGILSGAYYASGVHLNSTANLEAAPAGFSYPALSDQMNPFCESACEVALGVGSTTFCEMNCGSDPWSINGGDILDTASLRNSISGFTEPISNVAAINGFPEANTPYLLPNYSSVVPPGTSQPIMNTGPSAAGTPPAVLTRTSNEHFAGGMVYEMEMGPVTSICSANQAYWVAGASDFTHAGTPDTDMYVQGVNGNSPPERLICNHRHAQDDLYMSVGNTSSFAINGGNPF